MRDRPIKGIYADFRAVRTRKVLQVVIEIPADEGDGFFKEFGMPKCDDTHRWIQLVDLGAKDRPPEDHEGDKALQRAGILCKDRKFGEFLAFYNNCKLDADNPERVADELRKITKVKSRIEYRTNKHKRQLFYNLVGLFDEYKRNGD